MRIASVLFFLCSVNTLDFFLPNPSKGMEGTTLAKEGATAKTPEAVRTVFGHPDLVRLFTKCWTIRNYYVNRATRAWAISGNIEIEPVLFRGDVAGYESAARHGAMEPLLTLIRIGVMVWPPDIDPTAVPDVVALSEGCAYHRSKRHRVTWMEMLMSMHAAHIRRLSVHMSLCLDLSPLRTPGMDVNELGLAWKYEPAKNFLATLAKCTAIEYLSIEQRDYVPHNAERDTVQVKVLELVQKMKGLDTLEWNGNLAAYHKCLLHLPIEKRIGSICDYLPDSIRELYIKDGTDPRMDIWRDFLGISSDFRHLMRGSSLYWTPGLTCLFMPRSFWSLAIPDFHNFMEPINSGSIARIGVADPFNLMVGPSALQVTGHFDQTARRVQHPAPCITLYHLITHVSRAITIDIRMKTSAGTNKRAILIANKERARRIAWVESIPLTHVQFWHTGRADHEGFGTIFCFMKIDPETAESFIVRVLV